MTNLHRAQDATRVAFTVRRGLAAFLAGLDEFFQLLADWSGYRSPLAPAVTGLQQLFAPGAPFAGGC